MVHLLVSVALLFAQNPLAQLLLQPFDTWCADARCPRCGYKYITDAMHRFCLVYLLRVSFSSIPASLYPLPPSQKWNKPRKVEDAADGSSEGWVSCSRSPVGQSQARAEPGPWLTAQFLCKICSCFYSRFYVIMLENCQLPSHYAQQDFHAWENATWLKHHDYATTKNVRFCYSSAPTYCPLYASICSICDRWRRVIIILLCSLHKTV